MTTARELSPKESKMGSCTTPQSLPISEHSLIQDVQSYIEGLQTSLPPASHVSPSQSQDSEKQSKTKEICGLKPYNAFALYDHDTHFWKTSQACLLPAISDEYTETWPKQGIMLDGVCWELTIVEHHTGERDGGLWPTPSATERENDITATPSNRSLKGNQI